ncbi:SDR family NAD(P)-dependent oxidoreductase [Shouchella clausii]|jgi:NAD(P)-dependent dehydrogenase (short-subunit alcohol dehydrogenase family)|uniref:SDR family NAD(P)-dependent oxidoreductase n=1 Tax=Shouchella clausii TaxID=79880 RepID=UPI000B960872|nr:SDR family oxidoreductase [Shouchella clausii]AST96651.1 3-oxoacyl-ACP reductase [Shouchella clausii]MBU8596649.1 SDR family oxidoreductase [Shouchella clausii]MCY1105992.1 SDR family oxidoreductase [Shouchella clausii]MEB5473592.1 SDR family oxidoreductase [Shouchella clausii]MEB5478657.1 SDR family oxidoreductase [Shouchella clausii]
MTTIVMITGATKGLGRALAWYYGRKGYALAVTARTENDLVQLASALQAENIPVVAVAGDMAKAEDAERFAALTLARYNKVDVLINNASIFGPGPSLLLDYPDAAFQEVLLTNTLIPYFLTKQILPTMLARDSGIVITLTSEAGKTGFAEWGAYGISKFAVEGMVQTWADEVADSNVRFHLVDPGEMDTDMHAQALPDCDYPLDPPQKRLAVFDYLIEEGAANGSREEAIIHQQKEGER